MSFPGADHPREYPDEPGHKFYAESMIREGVARYKLAALLVKDRDVLDVACGSGYGPEILAAAGARSVYAVDKDPEAIEYCEGHFKRSTVKYRVLDARRLAFVDESFDVVVNHGSLQYNEPEDQERVVRELMRVLRPNGVAVVSVNYNTYTGPDRTGAHPYHVWAYDSPGLAALLRKRFFFVAIIGQYHVPETIGFMMLSERAEERKTGLMTAGAGQTTLIGIAAKDPLALETARETLGPYVRGERVVDLSPTWRGAV